MAKKKHYRSWTTRTLASLFLRALGWKVVGSLEHLDKAVVLGVPHTSNWDGILAIPTLFVLDANCRWLGKESLFRGVLGPISRMLGGIPIDRSRHQNFVQQAIHLYAENENFFLVIAPEGTRKFTSHWKSGFYHIARGADVPVVLGFVDYGKKEIGIGDTIRLTGDMEADMKIIRQFYQTKTPRHPENHGEIRLEPQHPIS
jgi:1-acyl-sn-glycerol-3-phosphate acyltransferase